MRMAGRVSSCCAALFLTLTTVSAFQKLNSINDLKKINFGQSVPRHSLLLLHWFANVVDIDRNNVMHLTFDPNSEDYGSHHYGNFEGILEQRPHRHQYYTIGNLNQDSPRQLPNYVLQPRVEFRGGNRDRIIIRVIEPGRGGLHWRVDRVYLTQHSGYQGAYDPAYTYEVTTNLLREIRQFSVQENQPLWDLRNRFGSRVSDSELQDIRNTWGDLACLGLLLFIVLQERYCLNQVNYKLQHNPVNQTPQYNPWQYSNLQAARNTDSDFFNTICTCFGVLVVLLLVVVLVISSSGMKR